MPKRRGGAGALRRETVKENRKGDKMSVLGFTMRELDEEERAANADADKRHDAGGPLDDDGDDDGDDGAAIPPIPVLRQRANVANAAAPMVLDVDPEDILIDPVLHSIRNWGDESAQELTIAQLAESIAENGQQERCLVYPSPEGYVLYIGERRYTAVRMLQEEGNVWHDGSPYKLRIEVNPDMDAAGALRLCLHENIHRENLRADELGRAVALVRKTFGWTDPSSTGEVAAYLGVSPATVYNAELVANAPEAVLSKILDGTMTASAAVALLRAKSGGKPLTEEKITEVLAVAGEEAGKDQRKEAGRKGRTVAAAARPGSKDASSAAPAAPAAPAVAREEERPLGPKPKDKAKVPEWMKEQKKRHKERLAIEKAEKQAARQRKAEEARAAKEAAVPVVSTTHVAKALKKTAATDTPRAPKLPEFIDFFAELAKDPAFPLVMQKAFAYVQKWAHGGANVSDAAMRACWGDVADALARGNRKSGTDAAAGVSEGKAGVLDAKKEAAAKKPPVARKPAWRALERKWKADAAKKKAKAETKTKKGGKAK
jgi:hypothetical protein